jgi:hypothetical protein
MTTGRINQVCSASAGQARRDTEAFSQPDRRAFTLDLRRSNSGLSIEKSKLTHQRSPAAVETALGSPELRSLSVDAVAPRPFRKRSNRYATHLHITFEPKPRFNRNTAAGIEALTPLGLNARHGAGLSTAGKKKGISSPFPWWATLQPQLSGHAKASQPKNEEC